MTLNRNRYGISKEKISIERARGSPADEILGVLGRLTRDAKRTAVVLAKESIKEVPL